MSEKFSTGVDDIDPVDLQIQTRRIEVYSSRALQIAALVERIYIYYSGFRQAITAMDRLFQLAGEFEMPQGMLLQGATGVGKTTVFKYFRKSLPSSNLFAPGLGAIGIRSSSNPTVGYLIKSLLWAYRYPFVKGGENQMYARRGVLMDLIRQKGTRLLFIDEAAGLLSKLNPSGTARQQTATTDLLREIVDECRTSLVLASAGPGDALDQLDPALSSRLSVRAVLNDFSADAEWLGFLRAYVKQCDAFDLKIIGDNSVAKRLHLASVGNLRQFKRLITEAVLIAADADRRAISEDDLATSFTLINGPACGRENVFR